VVKASFLSHQNIFTPSSKHGLNRDWSKRQIGCRLGLDPKKKKPSITSLLLSKLWDLQQIKQPAFIGYPFPTVRISLVQK